MEQCSLKRITILFFSLVQIFLFAPCCHGDGSYKFLVLGDWGGLPWTPYTTYRERHVAAAMNTIAGQRGTEFQLALGDNFYFWGVKYVNDKRFQETFEDVFVGDNLQTPWYMVAGNHDWNGNVSAQIAYTEHSKRWKFPNFYYTHTVQSLDGATLQLVLIDTVMLCGNLQGDFSPDTKLSAVASAEAVQDQLDWIASTLASSKADYLLVGGHYPVYSIAYHGPTKCLIDNLRPLLFKYNVTAYLCGHDHNLQHLHEVTDAGSMDYFVIGAANFVQNSRAHASSVPVGSSLFYNADSPGGFGVVAFNKQQMSMSVLSGDNKELYHWTMSPRNNGQ